MRGTKGEGKQAEGQVRGRKGEGQVGENESEGQVPGEGKQG